MPVPDPPLAAPLPVAVGLESPSGQFQLFDERDTADHSKNYFNGNGINNSSNHNGNRHDNNSNNSIDNGEANSSLRHPPAQSSPHPLVASKLISNNVPPRTVHSNGSEKLPFANGGQLPSLKAIPLSSYYKVHRVPSLSRMSEPDSGTEDPQAVKLPRRESTTEAPPNLPPNGIHNKILEQVVRTPGRLPSPQPTHLSVPGPQSRVLHEHGSGYVAPKFEGKELQMDQGQPLEHSISSKRKQLTLELLR